MSWQEKGHATPVYDTDPQRNRVDLRSPTGEARLVQTQLDA